jgi:hypothetical protein
LWEGLTTVQLNIYKQMILSAMLPSSVDRVSLNCGNG